MGMLKVHWFKAFLKSLVLFALLFFGFIILYSGYSLAVYGIFTAGWFYDDLNNNIKRVFYIYLLLLILFEYNAFREI